MYDRERKQELLAKWMAVYAPDRKLLLLSEGEIFSLVNALERIRNYGDHQKISDEEVIYILIAITPENEVPVYVGRATSLYNRWKAHLGGIQKGLGLYSQWCSLLFTNSMAARYPLFLIVVPGSQIKLPPISGFPVTVGAVEYQLVSLMADAYPSMTLNHEGRFR